MKIVRLQCPSCGGQLTPGDGFYVCNSCGATMAVDYDESDVEYEKLKRGIQPERTYAPDRSRNERAKFFSTLVAFIAIIGFLSVSVGVYSMIKRFYMNDYGTGISGSTITPTPAPNYNVTSDDLMDSLDDFIESGRIVQMNIEECAVRNSNAIPRYYSKTDAVFLDAYLVSNIPDMAENQACRLVLIYEVTWHNDEYGDQTCYDAVYFDGIRVNPNGGIISDYNGKTIWRSDAAWGWAMAYSFEYYSQCYLENVTALGGQITEVVVNSANATDVDVIDTASDDN